MAKRGPYAIRISGLKEGHHDFSFELDNTFFASFELSEIQTGNVRAQIGMEKKSGMISLYFTLSGQVEVVCDRCLEPYLVDVRSEEILIVKTGGKKGELNADVVIIGEEDHEIEVGQFMYEFVVLSLPLKRIHPDRSSGVPGCNPEMLRRLKDHTRKEHDGEAWTDPRWDVLKGIKKQ